MMIGCRWRQANCGAESHSGATNESPYLTLCLTASLSLSLSLISLLANDKKVS